LIGSSLEVGALVVLATPAPKRWTQTAATSKAADGEFKD